jgi:pimeloyl-ACP methyl ester carboxylesterase
MILSRLEKNCKIHYLDLGDSSDNHFPIIFLHGWGLEGRTFLPALRILAKNRRVISPDLPGFGRTHCNVNHWNYDKFAETITNLIIQLGIEKVHLIGHSLGAGICMKVCVLIPDRVSSLILLDSSGIPIYPFRNGSIRSLIGLLEQFTIQWYFSPKYSLLWMRSMVYNFLLHPFGMLRALAMSLFFDIRPLADQIQQRTLIVWGERDRTMPLEMGITLSQHLKDSHFRVLKKHYYHEWSVIYPSKFAEIASEFLAEIEQGQLMIE